MGSHKTQNDDRHSEHAHKNAMARRSNKSAVGSLLVAIAHSKVFYIAIGAPNASPKVIVQTP